MIINKKVLVPLFGIPQDEQALQTYRNLMPGYEVIGFTGAWYYYDALHCRTMGIFDPQMLVMRHKQPRLAAAGFPLNMVVMIDDRSETGLVPESLKLFWREQGNIQWSEMLLQTMGGQDSLFAQLPAFEDGKVIQYFFSAADLSGRQEKLPRPAPAGFYTVEFSDQIVSSTNQSLESRISAYPVPFSNSLLIRYIPLTGGDLKAGLYDASGRLLDMITKSGLVGENTEFVFSTGNLKSGFYVVKVWTSEGIFTEKVIKI